MSSRSRRHPIFVLAALFGALALSIGCASSGGSETEAAANVPPPAGHKLAKVTLGMNDTQVRAIMGEPDQANAYMTGKAWIPFYYGPDTARSDWMYFGQGRIVYSRNRYSGGLKVIQVVYNPKETGQ